ncbi:MAG TPA: hypothetical protein VMD77_02190 [Candidatus Baltobacteraceae bacterium]|nr:hypothetical protein [Verrucomicrobiae bacterium]HTX14076.1 hypothetical protein [Candidatus Baltobacteraceae bacterium]
MEHSWGEEFAENLLALILWNKAYSFSPGKWSHRDTSAREYGGLIELHLRDRK